MLKQLATFKAVYETKSFSQAAELLFIAQPTVSTQIKQLEEELHVPLFLRSGRAALVATPQADTLYHQAAELLNQWATMKATITPELRVPCRIGASHTFARYCLPGLLQALYEQLPTLHYTVQLLNSQAVAQAIQHHDLDFGFIEKPLTLPGITRHDLLSDQLVLAGEPDASPWLVREADSGVYHYTERYLSENDVREPRMEVASNDLIVELLHQGFGRSIISSRAATGLPTQPLGPGYERYFYLLNRPDTLMPPLQEAQALILAWQTT